MARPLNAEEFEELYRATSRDLIVFLRRRGSTDPENDLAEVYAVAWRRRADLPVALLRRAWLFGVAGKLLQAGHRKAAEENTAAAHLARVHGSAGNPGEDADKVAAVNAAMNRLASGDREILRLAEWERLTPLELATALGVRPGTARVRLHRARKALAGDPGIQALAKQPPHPPGSASAEPERSSPRSGTFDSADDRRAFSSLPE